MTTYLMEYLHENDIVHRDVNTDNHQLIEEPEGHRGRESDGLVTSVSFIVFSGVQHRHQVYRNTNRYGVGDTQDELDILKV